MLKVNMQVSLMINGVTDAQALQSNHIWSFVFDWSFNWLYVCKTWQNANKKRKFAKMTDKETKPKDNFLVKKVNIFCLSFGSFVIKYAIFLL